MCFLGLHETGRFFVEMNAKRFVRGERSESKTSILGCDRVEMRRSMRRSRRPQEELDVLKDIQFTGVTLIRFCYETDFVNFMLHGIAYDRPFISIYPRKKD